MSFASTVQTSGPVTELSLAGVIDEQSDFNSFQIPSGTQKLVINMKDIRLLNSVGLRSWVLWAKTLRSIPVIALKNCPGVVVHQMNILDGFIPLQAVVESFEVPYHCESCEHGESLWLERGKDFFEQTADTAARIQAPEEKPCPACGAVMEMDASPRKYFRFLSLRN